MCTPSASAAPGPQPRVGPDAAARRRRRRLPAARTRGSRCRRRCVTLRSTQFGPMRTRSPSFTRPSKTQFTSIDTSSAAGQLAAHVHAPEVGERDARLEQLPGLGVLVGALQDREFVARIHAGHFARVGRLHRDHRRARRRGNADHVGQVVLLLRVAVRDLGQPAGQPRCVARQGIPRTTRGSRSSARVASFCSTTRSTRPDASPPFTSLTTRP